MGLDMYLTKRTYVWKDYDKNKRELCDIVLPDKYSAIKPERIKEVVEEVAYWRKANHIHKWFVEKIQGGKDDCGDYYVSHAQLKELIEACKAVLLNRDKASEILPTQSGFFFASTDYDEYFFTDCQDTVNELEPLLEEKGEFYYHSSW